MSEKQQSQASSKMDIFELSKIIGGEDNVVVKFLQEHGLLCKSVECIACHNSQDIVDILDDQKRKDLSPDTFSSVLKMPQEAAAGHRHDVRRITPVAEESTGGAVLVGIQDWRHGNDRSCPRVWRRVLWFSGTSTFAISVPRRRCPFQLSSADLEFRSTKVWWWRQNTTTDITCLISLMWS